MFAYIISAASTAGLRGDLIIHRHYSEFVTEICDVCGVDAGGFSIKNNGDPEGRRLIFHNLSGLLHFHQNRPHDHPPFV